MNTSRPKKEKHTTTTAPSPKRSQQETTDTSLASAPLSPTYLQNILETLPHKICVLDRHNHILFFNQAFQTFLSRLTGSIITPGVSIDDVFSNSPSYIDKAQILIQLALQGESSTITDTITDDNNMPISYEITYRSLLDDQHVCVGTVISFNELSPATLAKMPQPSLHTLLNQRVSERTAILEEHNQALQREIVERRSAENALRQSEQNFRMLAEIVPQLIWVINRDGTPNYFNHNSREFLGISEHQTMLNWQQIIHPDDWALISNLGGKNVSFREELRMRRASDNTFRWQLIHATPIQDPAGKTLKWIASITDIDDWKYTEKTLRQSEQKLRLLTDIMPHIIWEMTPDGESITYTNRRWLEYRGLTKRQGFTYDTTDFVHPDDFPQVRALWLHALKTGEGFEHEFRIRRASDSLFRWHLTHCEPIKDANGMLYSWLGTSTDIHDSKIAEEKLRQSEQNFRLLADAMPQIVWTSQPDGWLDYYNQKWFDYTGMTLEQTQGWGWEPVLHPDDVQHCIDVWTHSVQTGELYQIEYRFKRVLDGMYRWHLGRALPVRDAQGQIVKWFGTGTDIHDWKIAQEQLALLLQNEQILRAEAEATSERLEQLNKIQSDFISTVSHEFRTTLTSIQGFSEVLYSDEFSPLEVKDYATDINTDAKRLTRMINDLLDLERMKSGKMTIEIEEVDLNHLLHEVVQRAIPTSPHHTLRLQLDAKLPLFHGDSDKIIQVLTNLLSNAIKYAPNGGEIVLTSKRQKNKVHISIQDQGIGIPPDALEEIFAPYSRIDAKRTRYIKGTGLGLAIVRQIVEMHSGQVWVESVFGSGSTFHVLLPIKL